ncbi:MAG: transporter [Deltaproteobacteria bacterium]|nr:transporter [Deltaproteobacteria bacterium]
MKNWVGIFGTTVLSLFFCGAAFGAGFHIHEQGAKAMGMANAFAAQADDPSALFYNPAGIAFQEGTKISLGVTVINVPETEFNGTTELGNSSSNPAAGDTVNGVDEKARKDIFFPPNLYITHSMVDRPFSFGIGFNSIYPLAKRWSSTSPFRDEIKELAIKPFNIQPTVAYRIDKWNLALAAGIDYTYAQVWLEKSPYTDVAPGVDGGATNLGDMEIEGDGDGWGYNFGLLWKPIEKVSVGVAYRSEIKLDISGDADFLSFVAPAGSPYGTFNGGASTEITLPDTWSFGIAYKPTQKLTLEFDADRFGWSSYKELDIDLTNSTIGDPAAAPKNWDDCWAYRFGMQYSVNENLDLRLGYAYDTTPQPDSTVGPELPDADRHNYTFGIGYKFGNAQFDLAYMFVDFKDRTVDNDIQTGTYKSEAHLLAANLTYTF